MISERDMIFVTKKQASITAALLAVLCLLIFVLGYFFGKQSVLDGFGQRAVQESLNDQVDYLLTMQSFADKTKSETTDSTVDLEKQDDATSVSDQDQQSVQVQNKQEFRKEVQKSKTNSKKSYHAILVGFGTKSAAISFVNRLKKHGISVEIKQRVGKTASGKTKRTWYQVVTKSYDSKDRLQTIVNKIKKLERIKDSDIKII